MLKTILKGLGVVFVLAIVVIVVLMVRSQPMPASAFFRADDPAVLVIAHQGGDGERPSNTMMAFQHAVDIGADVLEMDIHSTSDNVLVVIHDETVDRTTDGTGRVHDFTLANLQQLDAGYDWPTLAEEAGRTDRPYRGQGAVIPAFEEVLQAFPNMRLALEIKQETPSIVQPLCDLLRQYHMESQVTVASFREQPLYDFRKACPEVATAAVESEVRSFFILNTVGLSEVFQPTFYAYQVPEYSGDLHLVTPAFINNARAQNVMTQPWTINDTEGMQRMVDWGVNGVITDYPSQLLELLGRGTGE